MTVPTPVRPHTFHIPVMGTGFTIDTPLKVARYGIASVISIVDDILVEQMRQFHCERSGEPYEPIRNSDEDSRARRITEYLNLVDRLVARQVEALRRSPFVPGSEITRYYELLPDGPLKADYRRMLETTDAAEREALEKSLRARVVPGSIDVNIMTKVDADKYRGGEKLPAENSDAMAALRGFARSTCHSSIIFSAGLNQRLYSYAGQFDDFLPDETGYLRKKVVIKVSDFRSALIQGKFLAKRGLWVSEFRIESGLNCGGHAFATDGYLLGPILDEFRKRRSELQETMLPTVNSALNDRNRPTFSEAPELRVTVQGGIGTQQEQQMLLEYYQVDGTGWATPFLLVPEVTNVDEDHLRRLIDAKDEKDVFLSDASPFGIPFWNLRRSASEESRRARIDTGRPGSACPKGFLKLFNTEFTKAPICTASRAYQKLKLAHLDQENLTPDQREVVESLVLAKSCICHDLAGGATLRHGIDPDATTAVCCGPNIINFDRIATLEEMVGHIYGRLSLLSNPDRQHMFVRELKIYVDYLKREIEKQSLGLSLKTPKYFTEFRDNLHQGIEHYRKLASDYWIEQRDKFLDDLASLTEEIERLPLNQLAQVS